MQASIEGDAARVSARSATSWRTRIALAKKTITVYPVQFNKLRDDPKRRAFRCGSPSAASCCSVLRTLTVACHASRSSRERREVVEIDEPVRIRTRKVWPASGSWCRTTTRRSSTFAALRCTDEVLVGGFGAPVPYLVGRLIGDWMERFALGRRRLRHAALRRDSCARLSRPRARARAGVMHLCRATGVRLGDAEVRHARSRSQACVDRGGPPARARSIAREAWQARIERARNLPGPGAPGRLTHRRFGGRVGEAPGSGEEDGQEQRRASPAALLDPPACNRGLVDADRERDAEVFQRGPSARAAEATKCTATRSAVLAPRSSSVIAYTRERLRTCTYTRSRFSSLLQRDLAAPRRPRTQAESVALKLEPLRTQRVVGVEPPGCRPRRHL